MVLVFVLLMKKKLVQGLQAVVVGPSWYLVVNFRKRQACDFIAKFDGYVCHAIKEIEQFFESPNSFSCGSFFVCFEKAPEHAQQSSTASENLMREAAGRAANCRMPWQTLTIAAIEYIIPNFRMRHKRPVTFGAIEANFTSLSA